MMRANYKRRGKQNLKRILCIQENDARLETISCKESDQTLMCNMSKTRSPNSHQVSVGNMDKDSNYCNNNII